MTWIRIAHNEHQRCCTHKWLTSTRTVMFFCYAFYFEFFSLLLLRLFVRSQIRNLKLWVWGGFFFVSFLFYIRFVLFTRFVVKSELDTELNTNDVVSVWDMVCCLCIRRMHYKHVFLCWRMCVILEMCDIYFFFPFLLFSSLYSNQLTHNLTLCSI